MDSERNEVFIYLTHEAYHKEILHYQVILLGIHNDTNLE